MSVRLDPVSPSAVWSVAIRMRQRDRQEFEAVFGTGSATEIANRCAHQYGGRADCFLIVDEHTNADVGVGGFLELRPRVATMLMFATDDFARVGLAATKRARALIEAMEHDGIHRLECMTLAGYAGMRRWLELLGFRCEGLHAAWGANGEDFLTYARVRE